MRQTIRYAALPIALLAAACSGGGSSAAPTAQAALASDLGGYSMSKDLALAVAANVEMAPTPGARQRTVSAIEATVGTSRAPVAVAAKRRGVRVAKAPAPSPTAESTPETLPVTTKATEVAEAPPVSAPAPEPVAGPRPTPIPVAYPGGIGDDPAGGDRGRGDAGRGRGDTGRGIGGIFGVVIRGGGVDGDHCDPRGRHGRGGISINDRLPRLPGGGTFPINPMVGGR